MFRFSSIAKTNKLFSSSRRLCQSVSRANPSDISSTLNIPQNVIFEDISVLQEDSKKIDVVYDQNWYADRRKPIDSFFLPLLSFQPKDSTLTSTPTLIPLNPLVFDLPVRVDVIHQNVRWHRNCARQGTKKVKTISERRGTGKKPYPQKGRGKARHGSLRAVQFVKGGRVHGPHPRDYSFKLNKKEQLLGLKCCLSAKFIEDNIHVVDSFDLDKDKDDRDAVQMFLEKEGMDSQKTKFAFIGSDQDHDVHKFLILQLAKFPKKSFYVPQQDLHCYQALLADKIVITQSALQDLEQRLLFTKHAPIANQPKPESELNKKSFVDIITPVKTATLN